MLRRSHKVCTAVVVLVALRWAYVLLFSTPRISAGILKDDLQAAKGIGVAERSGRDSDRFPATPAELFRTHNVTAESPEVLADLYERARKVDRVCKEWRAGRAERPGKVVGIFTHGPSRTAYCFLPKAGCTFWIRVFSFLHNYTGDSVDSPWEIPRLNVHRGPHAHGHPWPPVARLAQDYLRFLFVRHPYSRLWSAYLDKLYLPDFWNEVGRPAIKALRGPNATDHAERCGSDVTFREFVEFSLTTYEPHWAAISQRCDPCQYRPALVGSMKTFHRDSLFLLRRMGLDWVLRGLDPDAQAEQELSTLVDYNFHRIRLREISGSCINGSTLAHRLWRTFQINGYVPKNVSYHVTATAGGGGGGGVGVTRKDFLDAVLKAFRASRPMKKALKEQRQAFLREALASLPPDLMERVRDKYHQDMLLFGFNDTNY